MIDIVLEKYKPEISYKDQKKFDCGNQVINSYVAKNLKKQVRQGITQCYVLLDVNNSEKFIGFYTLISFAIHASDLSELSFGSLPNRVPCTRLVMLGVDQAYKGRGLGKRLMMSAFEKTVLASESVGVFGLYLDADRDAFDFYDKLGFFGLKTRKDSAPTPMFLHIDTIKSALPPAHRLTLKK